MIVEHVGEEQPTPMDVGEVGEQEDLQQAGAKTEDVNSLGAAVGAPVAVDILAASAARRTGGCPARPQLPSSP